MIKINSFGFEIKNKMSLLTPEFGILFWVALFILTLAPLVLAIWYEQSSWLKLIWSIIIVCLPILGGITYIIKFFIEQKQEEKAA